MANIFAIPLAVGTPQQLTVQLSGTDYQLTLRYRNTDQGGWFLDIADVAGTPIISSMPLVTGANLLAQYAHLGINAELWVQTTSNPDAVPTFTNLGADAQLYAVTA